MPHIPAEAEAILKFLGSVVGFIATVVVAFKRIADGSRKKAQDAVEAEYRVDEPPTRRLPEVAPDDATVESLRALLKRVQRDNEALRESLREATRANDVEAQGLRRELAEAKKALADAEGKGAAQFYQLRRLESLVEVLQREVNDKRRDESAGLSTPRSDRPGVPTLPPGKR